MQPDLVVSALPVAALIPYAENARTHSPAQVTQIAASIAEFGFVNPVLVDAEGVLIAGHGRVMAAKQLGLASVRDAAAAILAAWDDEANREGDMIAALAVPIEALRILLAGKPARAPRQPGAPRKPREGTKQEQVLAMLRRPEGATVAHIAEATGWAQHTVRGFFAGLKKKGHAVEVQDRIRQVGPNRTGAKGSYTVYRINSPA